MVQPGRVLVSIAKIYVPEQGVSPQVIQATVIEAESIKYRMQDAGKIVAFGIGDTVYIREDSGQQFVLDGQTVASVSPGEIIYHKVKK